MPQTYTSVIVIRFILVSLGLGTMISHTQIRVQEAMIENRQSLEEIALLKRKVASRGELDAYLGRLQNFVGLCSRCLG